jgi:hypothetical protein
MAKLTTKARDALPTSKFAGPDRSYPVENRSHAANAKSRASQQEAKGNISKATEVRIDAKADRVLGERNANRTADRAVARISKPTPPR